MKISAFSDTKKLSNFFLEEGKNTYFFVENTYLGEFCKKKQLFSLGSFLRDPVKRNLKVLPSGGNHRRKSRPIRARQGGDQPGVNFPCPISTAPNKEDEILVNPTGKFTITGVYYSEASGVLEAEAIYER